MLKVLLDCIRAVLVQNTVRRGGGRRGLVRLGSCSFVIIYCTEKMPKQLLQSFQSRTTFATIERSQWRH